MPTIPCEFAHTTSRKLVAMIFSQTMKAAFFFALMMSASASDSDQDGLDDEWETACFGDLSQMATDDLDHDGRDNKAELDCGSDPLVRDGVRGALSWEFWASTGSASLHDPVWTNPPNKTDLVAGLGGITNFSDTFFQRFRGTITAPVTGQYTFRIAADDDCELWLSSDEEPFNRRLISSVSGYTSYLGFSSSSSISRRPVELESGKKYYLEILHREKSGDDHVCVAWSYTAADGTNLPEIPIWKNWCRESGAVATQSTTYSSASASQAIDGNRNGDYSKGSVTHTQNVTGSWWQVDLGENRQINRVVLYNRTDHNLMGRLSNFKISIIDASGLEVASRIYNNGYSAGPTVQWVLPTAVSGKLVKVSLIGPGATNQQMLSLSEVEVIGQFVGQAPQQQPLNVIPSEFLESYIGSERDENGDGLLDSWQVEHGMNTDHAWNAFDDADGDLIPLWLEAAQNLDPNTASSAKGFVRFERDDGVPDYSFEVYRASESFYKQADSLNLIEILPNQTSGNLAGTFFAGTMRGYITAPCTGEYVFWFSASSSGEFWLSTDEKPFLKQCIAALTPELGTGHGVHNNATNLWDQFSSQMSKPVRLEQGRRYYFETPILCGHVGRAHASLAWSIDNSARVPIPASALSSYTTIDEDLHDDDRLDDNWENNFGLNPMDNGLVERMLQGEFGDFDGDGLCNRDEYAAGTNPSIRDTDGDSLSDSDEIRIYGTNPLVADAPTEVIVANIVPNNFTEASGNWIQGQDGIFSQDFRGSISWDLAIAERGIYNIQVATSLIGELRNHEVMDILVKIDGKLSGRYNMVYGSDHKATLRVTTKDLLPGIHKLELFFDNYIARRKVKINGVEVLRPSGPDADSDGVADWVVDKLSKKDFVLPHGLASITSPSFIEGLARDSSSVLVGDNPAITVGDRPNWHYNLPLNEDGSSTPYTVTFDSGIKSSGAVQWVKTNVMENGSVSIRQGDSLRLTASNTLDDGMYTLNVIEDAVVPAVFGDWLPAGQSVSILNANGFDISKVVIVSGVLNGDWIKKDVPTKVYHFVMSGNVATCQLQFFDGTYTKSTKIKIEQIGDQIQACQLNAKYKSGNCLGQNFDIISTSNAPVGSGGYGVKKLALHVIKNWSVSELNENAIPIKFSLPGKVIVRSTNSQGETGELEIFVHKANIPDTINTVQNIVKKIQLFDLDTDRDLEFTGSKGLTVMQEKKVNTDFFELGLYPQCRGKEGIYARLWQQGPIVDSGEICSIGVADALQTESQYVSSIEGSSDTSLLSTWVVVDDLPEGAYVKITIFRGGVSFVDGTTTKIINSSMIKSGMIHLDFVIPKGMQGGYCHYMEFYDKSGKLIGSR